MRSSPSPARRRRARAAGSSAALAVLAMLVLVFAAGPASAHSAKRTHGAGRYVQHDLVSDMAGVADLHDPSLVNAWGLSFGPATPAWVADNGTGVSTLYAGAVSGSPVTKTPLTVSIPGGAPTGTVYNGSTGFVVHAGSDSGAARFLFASEAGAITGWNPAVPAGSSPSTEAQTAVTVPGAVFKGLAIADTATGPRLYAADFHHGVVDVWDASFAPVTAPGAFTDRALPAGYAPFNVQAINGGIVVTYAKQDAARHDEVAGRGKGFVDVYDVNGHLLRRLAARGPLNAPWGVALAPQGFGRASGALLIGNFGDGRIDAYDPVSARFLGALRNGHDRPITIDGLWALEFGNGVIGTPQTLMFTAGPADEAHGLFGSLVPFSRR